MAAVNLSSNTADEPNFNQLNDELRRSRSSSKSVGKFIVLTGEKKELCTIWQIRRNFSVMMILLTGSSFIFFLINFQLNNVKGSLVANTMSSQGAEILANVCSGALMTFFGPRRSFPALYTLSAFGTFLLLLNYRDPADQEASA